MDRVRTSTLDDLVAWLRDGGAGPPTVPGPAAQSAPAPVRDGTVAINMDGEQAGSLALLLLRVPASSGTHVHLVAGGLIVRCCGLPHIGAPAFLQMRPASTAGTAGGGADGDSGGEKRQHDASRLQAGLGPDM